MYKGQRVGDLAKHEHARGYLVWVLEKFDPRSRPHDITAIRLVLAELGALGGTDQ
jgi:hypothetical protein